MPRLPVPKSKLSNSAPRFDDVIQVAIKAMVRDGLALHKSLEGDDHLFTVTHVATGVAVCKSLQLTDALELLERALEHKDEIANIKSVRPKISDAPFLFALFSEFSIRRTLVA